MDSPTPTPIPTPILTLTPIPTLNLLSTPSQLFLIVTLASGQDLGAALRPSTAQAVVIGMDIPVSPETSPHLVAADTSWLATLAFGTVDQALTTVSRDIHGTESAVWHQILDLLPPAARDNTGTATPASTSPLPLLSPTPILFPFPILSQLPFLPAETVISGALYSAAAWPTPAEPPTAARTSTGTESPA